MARIAGVSKEQSDEKILHAALFCLANLGDKATTFQSIAQQAGVSPGLVVMYFQSRDQIYPKVLDHVLSVTYIETQQRVRAENTPTEKLSVYFQISIEIFRKSAEHAKIYLLLYHFASFDPKYREICTGIKEAALRRIEIILEEGKKLGEFPSLENIPLTARFIHNSLNGLLISILTNDQKNADGILVQHFEKSIFKVLGK
jgi:AcrR family transcriptional regulator